MIRRRITFEWRICCYDAREPNAEEMCKTDPDARAWTSPWNTVINVEEMKEFPESLVAWRDMMESDFEELVREEGEADCQDIYPELHLCDYRISVVNVEEEEIPEVLPVSEFVLETIKDLERRRDEAKTVERKEAIQKTIDELKREYSIS